MPPPSTHPTFALIDWLVVLGYMAAVIVVGTLATRRKQGGDEYFLAGRGIPVWAAAVSVLATAISAATFIGGPQQAYTGNLTYFMANLGGLLAILIVAAVFLPAFYRHNVTSVYELLGHSYGPAARRAASAMFMIGRVFASGARLFIVAIPCSYIVFNDLDPVHLSLSIIVVTLGVMVYTVFGGIRAVVWADVLQAAVFIGAIFVALLVLRGRIPATSGEIVAALGHTPVGDTGTTKLTVFDWSLDWHKQYTMLAAIFGWMLFNLAAFGTDQDLVQRMLTCRSALKGSWSAILSNLIAWPVVGMFLAMGLLLFVFYQRPDLMGGAAPAYAIDDTRTVFLDFILHEMGPGLRGLMLAGLFAAAMSSNAGAINALASTTIADFYRPLALSRIADPSFRARREAVASRVAVVVWSIVLAGFAIVCIGWQQSSGKTLIDFALGVMLFAYTGMLAVFLAAMFTNRGNAASAVAALAVGFVTVLLLQNPSWISGDSATRVIAMPWQMCIGMAASFTVVCAGKRREAPVIAPVAAPASS